MAPRSSADNQQAKNAQENDDGQCERIHSQLTSRVGEFNLSHWLRRYTRQCTSLRPGQVASIWPTISSNSPARIARGAALSQLVVQPRARMLQASLQQPTQAPASPIAAR